VEGVDEVVQPEVEVCAFMEQWTYEVSNLVPKDLHTSHRASW